MKILFVDDITPSYVMYPQTDGFLRELKNKWEVTVITVDTSKKTYDLRDYDSFDMILIWQSVTSHRHKDKIRIFKFPPNILTAVVISDFFHPTLKVSPVIYNTFMLESIKQSKFDIVYTTYHNTYEWSLLLPGSKIVYLPYCVDPEFFIDLDFEREDKLLVCCSTNEYLYPFRTRVIKLLENQTSIPCKFKVNANEQWGCSKEEVVIEGDLRRKAAYDVLKDYREMINSYKFFFAITSIGPGVELKFIEGILCGACVIADLPSNMFERYKPVIPYIHSCMTDHEILHKIENYMDKSERFINSIESSKSLVKKEFSPNNCVTIITQTYINMKYA